MLYQFKVSSLIGSLVTLFVIFLLQVGPFFSVSFVWVRRVCNSAAHYAAKIALRTPCSMFFLKDSLPLELLEVCKADFPPVTLNLWQLLSQTIQQSVPECSQTCLITLTSCQCGFCVHSPQYNMSRVILSTLSW